ncbi:hypothetical protein P6B95_15835 [Streptomyces atratus]|uniref:SCO2400 family protein n=1 Tax=Streptomyces atratus TaxID=1893 RepID=UPI001670652E|nr:hypothetical protein [Streptomyces atratus]WPW28709.1 hypothetical protein P6B95_15835 [Streptomyces atratus]GGT13438.1 hypothetical protein GCM10010207_10660 [Streptomyces atratus]
MDYCHPCQRHLNGALACAGCGTPAEALSHYATPAFSGHEPDAERETPAPSQPGGRRRRGHGAAQPARGTHGSHRPDRRAGAQGRGRRTHRRRGRTALLVVLGVVLAAGALSLAELAIEPKGDDGASDYVRESTSATTEPAPDPSASDAVEPPGPVGGPSVLPATDSHPAADGRQSSAGTSHSRPAAPASTASSAPAEPSSGPTAGGTPRDPSGSARSSGEPTKSTPPASPAPTPTPTESESCWWIPWFCQ